MHPALIRLIDSSFDLILARKWQARLGGHLLRRARGEGNSDWKTNGEARLMGRYKTGYLSTLESPVIFDVGANIGEWSKEAAQDLTPSTKVFSFEPSKTTFSELSSNIKNSGIDAHFILQNFGLSDKDSRATMYKTGDNAGTNSLYRDHIETLAWPLAGQEEIELKVGDEVAKSFNVDKIHLLKIDTEGNELAVMKGFHDMFRERRILCAQFEYGYCWIDSRSLLKEVFELLLPYGYRIGKICPWGVEFFDRYHHFEETFSFANYVVALPEIAEYL